MFGLSIFLYILMRAFFIPLTHDEAITTIYHAQMPFLDIIYFRGGMLANNHLLNTLLVKVSTLIFGWSELAIRIPALIGAIFYIFGSFLIAKKIFINSRFFFSITFIALTINPYIIDFLSLSRGYSLALGFFIWGLYYCLKSLGSDPPTKRRFLFVAFMFLALASISSLPFLNTFIGCFATIFFIEFNSVHQQSSSLIVKARVAINTLLLPVLPSVLFLVPLLTIQVQNLINKNELYFGGTNNFFNDTLVSLLNTSLYGIDYSINAIFYLKIFIVITILSTAILVVRFAKTPSYSVNKDCFFIIIVLFLIASCIEAQNTILGTKYILSRAAIFFIPLFIILFSIIWSLFYQSKLKFYPIFGIISFCITVVAYSHFLNTLNFSHFHEWSYDANTKRVLYQIGELKKSGYRIRSIGASKNYWPALNFYKIKLNLMDVDLISQSGPDNSYDAYYLSKQDLYVVNKYDLKIIKYFNTTESYLGIPTK